MGIWPIETYEEYVKKHSSPVERMMLARKSQSLWDESYPNIFLAYESLPEWMSLSNIISLDDRDMNFRNLLDMYRLAAGAHFESVKGWLEQIKRQGTGLALFAEIKATFRTVTILPYRDSDVNAGTSVSSSYALPGASARGVRLQQMWNPFEREKKPFDGRVGTGKGANTVVTFTPGIFTGSELRKPGGAPDEVLFHELVHASRGMRGVMDHRYVDHEYTNQEEFLAVVLTNIYLSEKGQTVLGNYDDKPLQGMERDNFLNNSQHIDFLSPQELMKNFKDSQPDFYKALANLPPPPRWNPVRQHNEFRRQHDTTPLF